MLVFETSAGNVKERHSCIMISMVETTVKDLTLKLMLDLKKTLEHNCFTTTQHKNCSAILNIIQTEVFQITEMLRLDRHVRTSDCLRNTRLSLATTNEVTLIPFSINREKMQ